MPIAFPLLRQKPFAQVTKTEEKGSDVNLATHLLVDAFDREAALQASQFPPILTDRQGTFHKSSSW
jgi:hypothetical protein